MTTSKKIWIVLAVAVVVIAAIVCFNKSQTKENQSAVLPVISSVVPNTAVIGSQLQVKGSNFEPSKPEFVSNGWLTASHVMVKIVPQIEGKGFTGILWEGGSQGGKQISSSNLIALTVPSKVCTVSEVASPAGCPSDKVVALTPGAYGIRVWVDGKGESDWADLTIINK
jgi:hypothetical protein